MDRASCTCKRISVSPVRTKPLAADVVAWWFEAGVAVHFCVTERSFCDTTTSTDAGRASAPELHTDTIPGYIHRIGEFAEYFGKSPELMGADEVREFQLGMIQEKKLALGTVALRMGALRFLYKKTD